ncbi:alpha/beta fold hydrolase [Thalassospira sp.]|uniref:alpha/beta hydrolase family protein n=1 Tax=Thalassospira sp. TaxID=1912094 RepID=UPI000C607947|nr:alpha/beta fold hydrolase [Thalassospira sp.]MBC07906.1 chlorophyllase [Thalassospira sp.]
MNNLITHARHIPVRDAVPAISICPVILPVADRPQPIEMRISLPEVGEKHPVILLSHGHGPSLYIPSMNGYGPLAQFYAEQGFVVIQPTHGNSKVAGFGPDAPGAPFFWRSRVEDFKHILDHLTEIEAEHPILAGRLDPERIAAVGHSLGGHTVGMLLGTRLSDTADPAVQDVSLIETRIKVGVLLAAPGNGGDSLSAHARANYTIMNPDFSHMTTRTLVVAGDADNNPHLTTRGAAWHTDPFHCSPGSDFLLTLKGGKHGLGGIAGYDAKETDDEDPDRLAVTQRMTAAYLRSAFDESDPAWAEACEALATHGADLAYVTGK